MDTIPQMGNFIVSAVFTNNSNAGVIERAKNRGVKSIIFTKEELNKSDTIINELKKLEIDAIILAGFLLLMPSSIILKYPTINIHPSLLPKFGGRGMYGINVHKAVIDSGESESGVTIHLIDSRYDEGKTLAQIKCPVYSSDSPESLSARVQELEHTFFTKTAVDYLNSI